MKKLLFFLSLVVILFVSSTLSADIIISEVCDHATTWQARYIEIYNPTDSTIDLTNYSLNRYANGQITFATFDFTGSIVSGEALVVANNADSFTAVFGFAPDWPSSSVISGNGNDVYELLNNGISIDIYGEIGVDGTGEVWEYKDSVATRVQTVGAGNTTWTAAEWTITAGTGDCTPKTHTCDYPVAGSCDMTDTTPPDWAGSGVSNIVVTNSSVTSVDLSWDIATDSENNTEAIKYDLYRSTSTPVDTGTATLVNSNGTATTYTDNSVTFGETYYYKVVAKNCVPLEKTASDEVSVTVPTPPILTIYDVQYTTTVGTECYDSPELSNIITLSGIVSAIGATEYTIEEASGGWHGILIYDSVNTPTLGDSVTVTGTVDEYSGLTELTSIIGYTVNSSGNTIDTATTETVENVGGDSPGVTCGLAQEAYEGVLVTFYNVEVSSSTGYKGWWRIKDQAGTLELDCDDTFYGATMTQGTLLDQVTGILLYGYDRYRLNPRSASDIVEAGCNMADATAPDWSTPGQSGIAAVDPGTGTTLNISWDTATDAENPAVSYDLYRDTSTITDTSSATLVVPDYSGITYSDTGLTTSQIYYYKVVAKNCVPLTTLSSDEASGTPTLSVTLTSICDIQAFDDTDVNSPAYSLLYGQDVWIKGIATVDAGVFGLTGTSIYVETPGGCGVNVFSYDTLSISEGDSITVFGNVEEYRGTTEVKVSDTTTFTITPSGTTITPELINTTLDETWQDIEAKEGQLVTFTGVIKYIDKTSNRNKLGIQDATDVDAYGITVFWYDGTGDITWDAVADFSIGDTVTIIGIVGQYDNTSPYTAYYQILPRYQSDIKEALPMTIAGNAFSHDSDWTTDVPVANLSISLFRNNKVDDFLEPDTGPNKIATCVTSDTGYFSFVGDYIEEGVTYIVYPEMEQDDLSPAIGNYVLPDMFIDGDTRVGGFTLAAGESITDLVIDMIDPVTHITLDNSTFNETVTLEWQVYGDNENGTANWTIVKPNSITYYIVISEEDEDGDIILPPTNVYEHTGVNITGYELNMGGSPGKYRWMVFADSYQHFAPSDTQNIPIASSDYAYTFTVTKGTPPELSNLTVTNNKTLELAFSEEVTLATVNILANYNVTPGDIQPISASRTNTDTVKLVFTSDFAAGNYTLTVTGVQDTDGNGVEISDQNALDFEITETSEEIIVFPNPANLSKILVINFGNVEVDGKLSIYNVSGHLVDEFDIDKTPYPVLIEEYAAGVYFYVYEPKEGDKTVGKFAVIR